MLIGENPPACAPWITIMPMSNGLIRYRFAKPSAIGAMIATAAGPSAPKAVSRPVIPNITHGMKATRPRTSRTAPRTIRSTVPLFWAIANRYVTPTKVRNRSLGKPAMMSSAFIPTARVPTKKAATNPSVPMLMGSSVAATNIATRARIGISSSGIGISGS